MSQNMSFRIFGFLLFKTLLCVLLSAHKNILANKLKANNAEKRKKTRFYALATISPYCSFDFLMNCSI